MTTASRSTWSTPWTTWSHRTTHHTTTAIRWPTWAHWPHWSIHHVSIWTGTHRTHRATRSHLWATTWRTWHHTTRSWAPAHGSHSTWTTIKRIIGENGVTASTTSHHMHVTHW